MTRSCRLIAFLMSTTIPLALSSCGEEGIIEWVFQDVFDQFWADAELKGEYEAVAEQKVLEELRRELNGKKVKTVSIDPGGIFGAVGIDSFHHDVIVRDVEWVELSLGHTPPKIHVFDEETGGQAPRIWSDDWYHYVAFYFQITWERGNGAFFRAKFDLRPWVPDHTVHVHDIKATGVAWTMVSIPKTSSGIIDVYITFNYMDVDLKAEAEGWFWSADIPDLVEREFVKTTVSRAIHASFSTADFFGED